MSENYGRRLRRKHINTDETQYRIAIPTSFNQWSVYIENEMERGAVFIASWPSIEEKYDYIDDVEIELEKNCESCGEAYSPYSLTLGWCRECIVSYWKVATGRGLVTSEEK